MPSAFHLRARPAQGILVLGVLLTLGCGGEVVTDVVELTRSGPTEARWSGTPPAIDGVSSLRGFIRIDPSYPRSFKFDNGERFFPFGDTSYGLMGASWEVIARYIDSRSEHGFNFIRFPAAAPGFWPFGGSEHEPDFSTIDEASMEKLDWVFDYAASRNINIELIMWGYDGPGGNGMWGDAAAEELWVDTLVRRYKDRSNLFMWTVTNEIERYPDGAYEYAPSDAAWVRDVAARVRSIDPVHAVGAHAAAGLAHDPLVVWPLWEGSDVSVHNVFNRTGQLESSRTTCPTGFLGANHFTTEWEGYTHVPVWDGAGWDFDAPGIEDGIAEDWLRGKPVINTEFGYQAEDDVEGTHQNFRTCQLFSPGTVRRTAWKTATAGGFIATGFVHTVKTIDPERIDTFRPEQLQALYEFFTTRTEYWRMEPRLELVSSENSLLAIPGIEYVAYFPRGGANEVLLVEGTYSVDWLHPESGTYTDAGTIWVEDGVETFTPPSSDEDDWVLHLRATAL